MFEEKRTYYETLELNPDATAIEIRQAYSRLKTAYQKDSAALYSLLSREEIHQTLRQIEEAYVVLSHSERKKQYDTSIGRGAISREATTSALYPGALGTIHSIDRTPPMTQDTSSEDLLTPPRTDVEFKDPLQHPPTVSSPLKVPAPVRVFDAPAATIPDSRTGALTLHELPTELQSQIQQELEWKGPILRSVREARGIPLDVLASMTKINRNYLIALEEDAYGRFPAPVYLRGFLIQISKVLLIPHERVVQSVLRRYEAHLRQRPS